MEENPFPSICGRVCGHPCEEACNRKEFDEPLAINALERFVGDFGLENTMIVSSRALMCIPPEEAGVCR
jgi:NADPH-dependent glutamate synthase beta subunit-like oxidoreductase